MEAVSGGIPVSTYLVCGIRLLSMRFFCGRCVGATDNLLQSHRSVGGELVLLEEDPCEGPPGCYGALGYLGAI